MILYAIKTVFNVDEECGNTLDALKSELLKMSSCLQKLYFIFLLGVRQVQ